MCLWLMTKKCWLKRMQQMFLYHRKCLKTAPLEDGPLRGVFRKNIIAWAKEVDLEIKEESINPFELQKADEIWLTNTIQGIQWVETYRKRTYVGSKATAADRIFES